MSETKERSGIFKFFYVFLSIVTFPIFAVLFVIRHPLWILFILILLASGAVYWPMSQYNVKLSEVVDWYQNKYQQTKFDLAKKAMSEGNSSYVPQVVLDEMKKIEEEAEEAKLPKGENYNAKVVRDKKSEEMKATLKQRGGFKKKKDDSVQEKVVLEPEEPTAEETQPEAKHEENEIDMMIPSAGGLSAILPAKEKENAAGEILLEVESDVSTEDETVELLPQKENPQEDIIDLDLGDEQPEEKSTPNEKDSAPVETETTTDSEDELDLF